MDQAAVFERYENFLKEKFSDKFEDFKKALIESKAIVSGSSVLVSLFPDMKNKLNSSDIDIYVNIKNSRPISKFLRDIDSADEYRFTNTISDKMYTKSFLYKNRIQKVVFFCVQNKSSCLDIDLMYVRDAQPLEEVIKNFDLTCCMNYYDGYKVKSFHLETTLQKNMVLTKDYHMALIKSNKFTLGRITKYTNRGFTLLLPDFKLDRQMFIDDNKIYFEKSMKEYLKFFIFCIVFDRVEELKGTYLYYLFNKVLHNDFRCNSSIFTNEHLDDENFTHISDYYKIGREREVLRACEIIRTLIAEAVKRNVKFFDVKIIEEFEREIPKDKVSIDNKDEIREKLTQLEELRESLLKLLAQ